MAETAITGRVTAEFIATVACAVPDTAGTTLTGGPVADVIVTAGTAVTGRTAVGLVATVADAVPTLTGVNLR